MGIKLVTTKYTDNFTFLVRGEQRVYSETMNTEHGTIYTESSLPLESALEATFIFAYFTNRSLILTHKNKLMYIFPRHCFAIKGTETDEVF